MIVQMSQRTHMPNTSLCCHVEEEHEAHEPGERKKKKQECCHQLVRMQTTQKPIKQKGKKMWTLSWWEGCVMQFCDIWCWAQSEASWMTVCLCRRTASSCSWSWRFPQGSREELAYGILKHNTPHSTAVVKTGAKILWFTSWMNTNMRPVPFSTSSRVCWLFMLEYGIIPREKVSHSKMPKLHTSLSVV